MDGFYRLNLDKAHGIDEFHDMYAGPTLSIGDLWKDSRVHLSLEQKQNKPAHRATLVHSQQLRRTVGTCTYMATGKQDHLHQRQSKVKDSFVFKCFLFPIHLPLCAKTDNTLQDIGDIVPTWPWPPGNPFLSYCVHLPLVPLTSLLLISDIEGASLLPFWLWTNLFLYSFQAAKLATRRPMPPNTPKHT